MDNTSTAGDFNARLTNLRQMMQQDPQNPLLRQHFFDMAASERQFDVIIDVARTVLEVEPDNASVLFRLSNAQIGKALYRDALTTLNRIRSMGMADVAIDANAGLCHFCLQEFVQAKLALDTCYASNVRTAGTLRLLISTYHHLGLVDEAVAIARANETPAQADAALAGAYALLFLDANDAVRASQWAKVALSLNPQSVDGRVTQATLLTARMQTDQARQMFESVLRDAPSAGRGWVGLGSLDLLAQDLSRARQHLARGVEFMPAHVGSWHMLAWAEMVSGDLDKSQSTFEHALGMDRNFAETHGGLAAIAAMKGDQAKARHLIDVALRLDPGSHAARFAQSVLARKVGNEQQAQQLIADAIDNLTRNNSSALTKLLGRATRRTH